ncbi:manganese catalase family protein [Acuticoccus sp.]|uniref:manganese catalase family protein n=1 Tax=Acuticoccus sp. TaxID=1904378 RepID=UPI003B519586
MFYVDYKLQYPVNVETPNPVFARALQQAIGGIEGEVRVAMQYMFQGMGLRAAPKYKEMLLNTAAEELGHIEMLATAVAKNLEGAPLKVQEAMSADPVAGSVLNGMNFRQILSTGLAALPVDADGVPFSMSHVYASGNIAGDMYANVTAEATGRTLATRLYNMTSDPGMKDMLAYLIARDTMHQNQWLAVLADLETTEPQLPVPNSFPQEEENQDYNYVYLGFTADGAEPPRGRWSEGQSIDGRGTFSQRPMEPQGPVPAMGPPAPETYPQEAQLNTPAGEGTR